MNTAVVVLVLGVLGLFVIYFLTAVLFQLNRIAWMLRQLLDNNSAEGADRCNAGGAERERQASHCGQLPPENIK